MDLELLERTLAAAGEPEYRVKQVWEWTARGVGSYEEMTNLPAALRLGFDTRFNGNTLDNSSTLLVEGERCRIASLTQADGPPPRRRRR